jgi:surface protein
MFESNNSFNQDIGNWNTSKVTNMTAMFVNTISDNSQFNQNIGNWDVSNVTIMDAMFMGANNFNQNLTEWCVSQFNEEPNEFSELSGLIDSNIPLWDTCANYLINVSANSNSDYTLSGRDADGTLSGNDVSISMNLGDIINFNVNALNHPFYIKTIQGTGTDNQASGINNNYPNGASKGVISWTPSAAGTYYYQCSIHNDMYGIIIVQ